MKSKTREFIKHIYRKGLPSLTVAHRLLVTPFNKLKNSRKPHRRLEIGPGPNRLDGFETMNVVAGLHIDYVGDAARTLPFPDGTFDLIYASHVLEHIPWYQSQAALNEWVRVLKRNGALEIWVPDGLKIAQTFVESEMCDATLIDQDGWYRFNEDHDPCVWASGRLFSYGDGTGRRGHPNWHLAIFSERYLTQISQRAGLKRIERLNRTEVRGHDHGWINLGIKGIKL